MNDDKWVIDGEITVPGRFRDLLKRNVENKFKIHILSKKIPATYNIFDIIPWKRGRSYIQAFDKAQKKY